MKRQTSTSMVGGICGLGVWAWMILGVAYAQGVAPKILPVDSRLMLMTSSAVTVSILDQTGADITGNWLPEWNPAFGGVFRGLTPTIFSVYVVVNSATPPSSVSLVPSPPSPIFTGSTNPFLNPLSTSAYPGQCTNYPSLPPGSPPDLSQDFDFNPTGQTVGNTTILGYLLTPRDCGGMAVIQAVVGGTTYTFILPQASNASSGNAIPDVWATTFCSPASACGTTGKADADAIAGSSVTGDGIFALDEFRGFIVSGRHIRTDPRLKDVFVHLVNPQCTADPAASLLITEPFVTGIPLFTNVNTLISGSQIHVLNYTPNAANLTPPTEWVDDFDHYSVASGIIFHSTGTQTPSPFDRQINQNAVYFDTASGSKIPQKGLRIIECLDTSAPSLLGFASLGSPNGPDNSIVFTLRIVNYFINTLGATCTVAAPCSYSTFQNGAWTTPVPISQNDLIARAIEFYLAMEVGHTIQLTPTVEGTTKTSYGYHHAPGTGSNLDQAITNKVSNKTGNTFYIPLLYNTGDQQSFNLK